MSNLSTPKGMLKCTGCHTYKIGYDLTTCKKCDNKICIDCQRQYYHYCRQCCGELSLGLIRQHKILKYGKFLWPVACFLYPFTTLFFKIFYSLLGFGLLWGIQWNFKKKIIDKILKEDK